jgi:predicted alpha/beta-hydrolase family hydrolase
VPEQDETTRAGHGIPVDAAWRELVPAFLAGHPAERLVVGGRSAGARVACRNAPGDAAIGLPAAAAVVCLAFPLHPPGRPERSRAPELRTPPEHGIPTLVVQGERDPFGSPEEVRAALAAESGPVTVHPVKGNHSPTSGLVAMSSTVGDWLDGLP